MRNDDVARTWVEHLRDDLRNTWMDTWTATHEVAEMDGHQGDAPARMAWEAVAARALALLTGEDVLRGPTDPPPDVAALRTPFELSAMERGMLRDMGREPDDFVGFTLHGQCALGVSIGPGGQQVLLVELACPLPVGLVAPLQDAVSSIMGVDGRPSVNAAKMAQAMPILPQPRYLIPRAALTEAGRKSVLATETHRFDAPEFFREQQERMGEGDA